MPSFLLIVHLVLLTTASGFGFAYWLDVTHGQRKPWFVLWCGCLVVWILLRRTAVETGATTFQSLPLLIGAGCYVAFVCSESRQPAPYTRITRGAAASMVALSVVISLAGQILGGVLIASVLVLAGLVACQHKRTNGRMAIVVTVLTATAITTSAIPPTQTAGADALLFTIALILSGQQLLKTRPPVSNAKRDEELRALNRDLQDAIRQLSSLRTERDRLEQELATVSDYKATFMTNLSHRLRTPLNSIVGYSELLQQALYGEVNELQADRLQKIHRSGQVVLTLVHQMLDLSRIEAGRLNLTRQRLVVDDLVQLSLDSVRSEAEAKGLFLHANRNPGLLVYGDHQRLIQVIRELLLNAVHNTVEGSVGCHVQHITVKSGSAGSFALPAMGWLKDGEWVIMAVSDTGTGIAPELHAEIFDEFFQTERVWDAEASSGLGLTICKKLIELHDGTIWLMSAPGQGSQFIVALPCVGAERLSPQPEVKANENTVDTPISSS